MNETVPTTAGSSASRPRAPWGKPAAFLGAVAAAFVAAWALGAGEKLASLKDWIGGLGPAGPFAFAALYALATVAAVPGFALTLVAGALFGTLVGTMAVSAGSTIGAALAFLLSRTVARRAVEQWLGRNEKFRKLDELAKRHGAILVAIVRLVPLFPFNLVNYGLGLTRIPFRTYLLWSWLCMLPGTVLYVGTADAASTTVAEGRIPWRILALVAAVGILVATLARAARRRLET